VSAGWLTNELFRYGDHPRLSRAPRGDDEEFVVQVPIELVLAVAGGGKTRAVERAVPPARYFRLVFMRCAAPRCAPVND